MEVIDYGLDAAALRRRLEEVEAERDRLRSVLADTAEVLLTVVDEDGDPHALSENVGGIEGPHERQTRFIHSVDCDQVHALDGQEPCARDCGGVYITTEMDGDVRLVVEVRS